jgi:hypothetical protein
MEEGWSQVYSTTESFHAEMIKQMLEDNEIPASLINKKDSNAFLIGDIEVYVPTDFVIRAIQLINAFDLE